MSGNRLGLTVLPHQRAPWRRWGLAVCRSVFQRRHLLLVGYAALWLAACALQPGWHEDSAISAGRWLALWSGVLLGMWILK